MVDSVDWLETVDWLEIVDSVLDVVVVWVEVQDVVCVDVQVEVWVV